ncbi:LOW QUALITY PROTEIN: hypothetical protein ACHAXA_004496 [Cyclostephanos tholiformis]|uniref:RecF/RecN/SMC N-terminal domain-containing protein n=1 Tax=Cyclostephanos tholiformis TaxID=382380 RepID=A0ABD3RDU0_9STRA
MVKRKQKSSEGHYQIIIMPTQKRVLDLDEKEGMEIEGVGVAHDKENGMNGKGLGGGGGKRVRGGGRKSYQDDDYDDGDEYQQGEEGDEQRRLMPQASPQPQAFQGEGRRFLLLPSRSRIRFLLLPLNSPLRDRHLNPKGTPAEAGIIHEVYVENFMCHRKLSVKLCRNVNFIHGQNGSGKSAILAAIQVCLGAGARRTHRARNLRDLVRKEAGADCPGARLRVTLLNGGADGYMPDLYGEYITVERLISLRPGGFNGYKLLDSNMKERSRSKKDLDAMLDQLNIQVENPVAVLDQEEAKKFLTGKEEDKYAFFVKATELERLDRAYASVQDNILEQQALQERAREGVGGAIENTKRLKMEWEQFRELDKLEMEAQELRAMYGWSCHREFMEQLDEEMKAQKYSKALEKRRVELATAEQSLDVTDDQEIELKKEMESLTEEASDAAESKTRLENEVRDASIPVKSKERERSLLARELAQEKKKRDSAVRRLEQARRQILESQGNVAEEERARTRKIAQTEADLARAKEQVEPLREEVAIHLRKYQEIEPALAQTKETLDGTMKQLVAVQQKLTAMQQESGEGRAALAVFGSKCKALYEAVQRATKANKFQGPVAGPVGMYVKVVRGKEKYAKIAELAIGSGALDRFIVTCHEDFQLLNKLRREIGCGPRDCPLYRIHPKSTKQRYDIPAPPPGVETVTSVLNVENAMAFNMLVDLAKIDTSALADSKEISEEALLSRENGRSFIKGGRIGKVYFLPKGDHWEAKGGNVMMVSNDRGMKQTVGVDRSAAIESAKHELKALQQELVRNQEEQKGVNDASYQHKKAWNDAKANYSKVSSRIKNMEEILGKLRDEAETSEEAPTIDTTEYENDIQEAETAVQDLKKKEAAVVQEIESLQPGLNELRKQLEEVDTRNSRILEDMEIVEAKLEDIVNHQTQRMEMVEKIRAKVQQLDDAVTKQEDNVAEIKGRVSEALAGARKMQFDYNRDIRMFELKKKNGGELPHGEELELEPSENDLEEIDIVDPGNDSKFYKTKLQNKLRKIEQEKQRRNMSESDPVVARDKYFRARKDLDSKMEQIHAIERNTKALTKDLKERRARWRDFRRHIAELTNLGFDEMLNKKGSAGEVEFDHEAGRLNLIVQKSNTDAHSQTKDVKALSGGERSFATLSLLLAIGESLETPFRVMDEFDVFLDPVARKIAMENLVRVAKEMDHRQFIFITPQDVSNLQTDQKLRIFKMKPPVRNDSVGGAQQQTLNFES